MLGICNNLGLLPEHFFPAERGADYRLSPYLELLGEHRDDFTVFSGVWHPDVDGGHPADNCFLTAAPHPGSAGFRNSISLDQYIGERIDKAESTRRCEADNEYIFTIDDDWDLDGKQAWNPARFINHSCTPNCEAEWDEGRIFVNALRDIKQGEELFFNYGYDMEDYLDHICQCRTSNCVGFIVAEEHWDEVRKLAAAPKACAETSVAGNLTA